MNLNDLGFGNVFLNMTSKAQTTEVKIGKLDFKIKNVHQKKVLRMEKPTGQEKWCPTVQQ